MKIAIGTAVASQDDVEFVVEADRLGASSVWVAEAWGQDAFTPLAYLAAHTERIGLATGIAQLGARTPAMLAMSAMSMSAVGRAVRARPRHQRAPGDGGLARCALRRSGGDDARDDRDRAHRGEG